MRESDVTRSYGVIMWKEPDTLRRVVTTKKTHNDWRTLDLPLEVVQHANVVVDLDNRRMVKFRGAVLPENTCAPDVLFHLFNALPPSYPLFTEHRELAGFTEGK